MIVGPAQAGGPAQVEGVRSALGQRRGRGGKTVSIARPSAGGESRTTRCIDLGDTGAAAKNGLPRSSSDSGWNRLRAASSPAARSPGFTELKRYEPVLRGHAS